MEAEFKTFILPLTKHAPHCLQRIETAIRQSGGAITLSVFRLASCVMGVVIATITATRQAAVSSFLPTSLIGVLLCVWTCATLELLYSRRDLTSLWMGHMYTDLQLIITSTNLVANEPSWLHAWYLLYNAASFSSVSIFHVLRVTYCIRHVSFSSSS